MTLLASQLLLSRKDIAELRIHDAYALHRVVYSLFENVRENSTHPGESAGLLYADAGMLDRHRRILLLSNRPPRSRVADRYGRIDSKPIAPSFLSHDRYRLQVVANPVVERNGHREPIRKVEQIKQWFVDRAPSWGFDVDQESLDATVPTVQRIQAPSGHKLSVSQSRITGVLSVKDRERFIASFQSGIGRARAFGCGLLQVKPIISSL